MNCLRRGEKMTKSGEERGESKEDAVQRSSETLADEDKLNRLNRFESVVAMVFASSSPRVRNANHRERRCHSRITLYMTRYILRLIVFLAFKRGHAGSHDLVDEQEIRGDDGARVEKLDLDSVIVEDAHVLRQRRFPGGQIQTDALRLEIEILFLQLDDGFLRVVAAVGGQRLGDDEQCVGEGLHAKLSATFDFAFVLEKRVSGGDFESSGARDNGAIFQRVLDGAQSVANGVLQLRQRVLVGTL